MSSFSPNTTTISSNKDTAYNDGLHKSPGSVGSDAALPTTTNSSLYESAQESLTADECSSFDESSNNNTTDTIEKLLLDMKMNSSASNSEDTVNSSSTIFDLSNASDLSSLSDDSKGPRGNNNSGAHASASLIQSESTDTITWSQEEVDPKSQLANKTVFKTDNPNLSIIEINSTYKDDIDIEKSVVVVEPGSGEPAPNPRRSPNKSILNSVSTSMDNSFDKRRQKPESLLHSSKQKLNIAIAEASANEHAAETPEASRGQSTNAAQNASTISKLSPRKQTSVDALPKTKRQIEVYDSIEEFEQNLPSTVTVLDPPIGNRVYLVGTAHFSEESQDDVSYVIRNVRPDIVMVELCPSRIHILKLDEQTLLEEAKSFNLSKIRAIIQSHGYINGIFFIMLLQMSAQIAKDLGMAPGGEFRRAFEEIKNLTGCVLHLGDRPVRITLHRALRALSFWQTCKLVVRLLGNDSISIEEVEECKQQDLLEKLMHEMAGEFPAFSEVFVTERDMFLCHALQSAALTQIPVNPDFRNGPKRPVRVVGVVGIGHANGIAAMWGKVDPDKIPNILTIPPASLSTRIGKATIKYGFFGLVLFGAYKLLRPRLRGFF